MVTLLKRFSYSAAAKLAAILLFCISAFLMAQSLIGAMGIPREKSWYETYSFIDRMTYKAGFVRDWIVRYEDGAIFNASSVTKEQIESYKRLNDTIQNDDEAIAMILKDRQTYFKNIEKELIKDNVNIEYLAVNLETGRVVTNIKDYHNGNEKELINELMKRPGFLFGNGSSILKNHMAQYDGYGNIYLGYIQSYYKGEPFEGEENFEVYVAISDNVQEGDWFYYDKQEFERGIAIKDHVYLFGSISVVAALILLFYWTRVIGQKGKDEPVIIGVLDKIPFELQFIGYAVCMFIWLIVSVRGISYFLGMGWMPYTLDLTYGFETAVLFGMISIGVCITLVFASSIIKHIKNHTLSRHIAVIRVARWLFINLAKEKALPVAAVLVVGAYCFTNMMLLFIMVVFRYVRIILIPGMIFTLGFNIAAALLLLKVVLDYLALLRGSRQILQGNLRSRIKLQYALPVMNEMADTINHIGEGMERSVEDSLKSERLKTELITNVSHDLKTPLTSIISYVDLLKEEPIDNSNAKEYIQILDERSNRLKQLVEDLVEASKAVTGNVKANLAPVELHQLVKQAVGEYTDRLEESELTIVMSKVEEIHILADGRHMYRIFENLLSNVRKYAMSQTRVYIDIERENGYGVFVIKNISKEHLNVSVSELTKRFVRGDKSRSTEGSGLGLAIAESLTKLQNGIFNIYIDGDLFKVEVKIPLC